MRGEKELQEENPVSEKNLENNWDESDIHLTVLRSLIEAYNTMHVIDLETDVFYTYKSQDYIDVHLKQYMEHATEGMKMVMTARVNNELLNTVLEFSDLTTMGERLKHKQYISMDFIGREKQWMRATFFVMKRNAQGCATKVVFTTQNIHQNKIYIQELLKKINIDELTGLYNRRAYENDKCEILQLGELKNLALFMFDIDGLKKTNDTLGHQAGDELILAASKCMSQVFSKYGKIYRIGGDEFVCLAYLDGASADVLCQEFTKVTQAFRGKLIETLSVSVGYSLEEEIKEFRFSEMERMSDSRLYEEKGKHHYVNG